MQLRSLLVPLVGLSFVSNLAVLISPIFMMQVLDRVIPSGNVQTLILLLGIALCAIATNAFVEFNRDITLDRSARWADEVSIEGALTAPLADRQDAINSVIQLRQFFRSNIPLTALNVPWLPLFFFALFLIHPYFLLLALGLVLLFWVISRLRDHSASVEKSAIAENENLARKTLTDISTNLGSEGMDTVVANLRHRYKRYLSQQYRHTFSTDVPNHLTSSLLAMLRMASQLLSLSLGAFLFVSQELTAGGMIGASIISAKTVTATEAALKDGPQIRAFWSCFKTLSKVLNQPPSRATEVTTLSGALRCEGLIYPRGGGAEPRLNRVSFALEPGECLGIIGDSGSGKSTLLNALSGVSPAPIGAVFLEDSEVGTLGPETRRNLIGYLPQQATLLAGTVAENISSFSTAPQDGKIISAAKTAGVHGLISALPQGYDTVLDGTSALMSAGQKQRVALARVIYDNPKYLFLDEPNSLLDASGERQLCDTLSRLKKQGVTILMVMHRSGIMGLADKVLVLDQGKMADYGPRSEVLGRMNSGQRKLVLPVNSSALQDLADWIASQFVRNTDQGFCQKAILAATEMFNAACLNGPDDVARKVTFSFRFKDSKTCNIRLTDSSTTGLEGKLPKIKSLIHHPEVDMIDIEADEMALAVVMQLSDSFEAETSAKSSYLDAWLTSDTAPGSAQVSH